MFSTNVTESSRTRRIAGPRPPSTSYQRMTRLLVLGMLLCWSLTSAAQGFDVTYNAYVGDLDGNGRLDLYVKGRTTPFIPITVDDLTIVVPTKAVPEDFVLVHNADHTSSIQSELTAAQRAAVGAWPAATVSLVLADFNVDGVTDILITGVSAVTGALDEIVFASGQRGLVAPFTNTSVDDDMRQFVKTVRDWTFNRSTLVRNQYTVIGAEPASRTWVAFFYSSSPSSTSVVNTLNRCPAGRTCALSYSKPLDSCVKIVDKYDANDNYIGTGPEDVCQYSVHVWAYAPGSVTIAQNAAFHQDAVNFINALQGVSSGTTTGYTQIANSLSLLTSYLGAPVSIGSQAQQCEDGPAVSRLGYTGLGPLAIPAGVYYCAAGAVIVGTAVVTVLDDWLNPTRETTVYSGGKATTPRPHTHTEEHEARDFKPDPFGDDCDPPRGNGRLRYQINVLRAMIAWRITDLNPEDQLQYMVHYNHINFLKADLKRLEMRYRDICGKEP